jgi:hypothetical protein
VTRAKISEYSATANDNTDVNGVNIAEGCPPSSMNNMGREIMAALKRFQVGSDGDGVTVGGALVVSGSTTANTFSATAVNATGTVTFSGSVILSGTTTANTFSTDLITEKTSAAGVTVDGVLLKDSEVTTDVIKEKTSAAGVTVDGVLLKDTGVGSAASPVTLNSLAYPTEGSVNFRNRIINGDMRIDQRNAGAAVTVNSTSAFYAIDRFFGQGKTSAGVFTLQQSTTAPSEFTNSVVATVTTADSTLSATALYEINQQIEGFNVADLGWGTASAKTVTLSFWVRSSLTGTFGGALRNSDANRSYPFSYSISSANTWEYKTVTIAGDTTGTWLTNNGIGIRLTFSLGEDSGRKTTAGAWASGNYASSTGSTDVIATNGATFYVTGVQLEVGSVATPFERRPFGTELALCQRYYYKILASGTGYSFFGNGFNVSTTQASFGIPFKVTMRTRPTALEQSGTAGDYVIGHAATVTTCSSVPVFSTSTNSEAGRVTFTVSSGLTTGQGSVSVSEFANSTAYLAWSAEL